MAKLSNKRKVRWLNIIDEYSRECLASIPRRSWKHHDVIEALSGLFVTRGCPAYIRSDNGSEFTAIALRNWLHDLNIGTAYIEPGSPWENGYCESFNARMRDEFLNGELFDTMTEAEILTRRWVNTYNSSPAQRSWLPSAGSAGRIEIRLILLRFSNSFPVYIFGG